MMVLLLLYLIQLCQCQGPPPPAGPPPAEDDDSVYVFNFESPIYVCPDVDSMSFLDTTQIECLRANETTAFMTGKLKFHKMLEPKTMVEVIVLKEQAGNTKLVYSTEICDVCAELADTSGDYYKYTKYIQFPEACPFLPLDYDINNLIADTSELQLNNANAGNYQIILNVYHNPDSSCKNEKEFIGCVKLDVCVEPL